MTVTLVSTGGTIATPSDDVDTDGDSTTADDRRLRGADLVAAVPGLDAVDLRIEDFATVPSTNLTVEEVIGLADRVGELDADPDVDGVVITQGTDTLEETAYLVDLCYGGETPVVVTGAMRNPSLAGPDGPANLHASIHAALDPGARDRGVLVCFAGRLMSAREAQKTHSRQVDTFACPEFGPLGAVEGETVTWRRRVDGPDPTFDPDPEAVTNDVAAVTVTVDVPGSHLRRFADCKAVCVAAPGLGNLPPHVSDAVADLRADDVPIVATTRCPQGRIARPDAGGSPSPFAEHDCLHSDVNLLKTRIRTIVALATARLDDAFD